MKLGIIGGSGIYNVEGIKIIENIKVETPFGSPSSSITKSIVNNSEVYFLARHGEGHVISPSELNHKANIFALKKLGVTHILAISAVGSFKNELPPKTVVMIDQYFDRTKKALEHTFFGNGIVGHISMANPICEEFKNFVYAKAVDVMKTIYANEKNAPKAVNNGTYLNMEGPAFSTKAESKVYKSWGMDVIGMTSLAEAKLAREAEISYCTAAMVTDFDSWHSEHENVSVDMVVKTMISNTKVAKELILKTASDFINFKTKCSCHSALKNAVMTSPEKISPEIKAKLSPIIGKYFN